MRWDGADASVNSMQFPLPPLPGHCQVGYFSLPDKNSDLLANRTKFLIFGEPDKNFGFFGQPDRVSDLLSNRTKLEVAESPPPKKFSPLTRHVPHFCFSCHSFLILRAPSSSAQFFSGPDFYLLMILLQPFTYCPALSKTSTNLAGHLEAKFGY